MMEQKLINVKELMAFLGCSRTTVFYMVRDGRLPSYKIGKFVRFDVKDVQALVERSKK
jgi:excisionase family DNA binding protein